MRPALPSSPGSWEKTFSLCFCLPNTFLAGIRISLGLSFHSIFYLVLWKRKQSFRCTSSYIATPLHGCCHRATKGDTVKLRIISEIHIQPAWTIQTAFEVPQTLSPGLSFLSRAAPRLFPSFSTACDAEPLWGSCSPSTSLPSLAHSSLEAGWEDSKIQFGNRKTWFLGLKSCSVWEGTTLLSGQLCPPQHWQLPYPLLWPLASPLLMPALASLWFLSTSVSISVKPLHNEQFDSL